MDLSVDRRQVLKAGAGVVAGAAVVAALPSVAAEAATPVKKPIGTAGIERLWGSYFKTINKKRTKVLRTRNVWSGTDKKTLDRGGLCHWIGTAQPLSPGNCVLFGHRTAAGGLLRNCHKMKVGDQIVLQIGTQTKTYVMVEPPKVIGSRDFAQAINWGDKVKSHITLVACTKENMMPTSTKFRLLIRATEI